MQNNDILRRLRFTFDLNDEKMLDIFALAEIYPRRDDVCNWLKKEDAADFETISDEKLASFLNGFISYNRGKKDGELPTPEKRLTNNLILRKLKIALNLQDEDMIEIFMLVGVRISKSELGAFFRKDSHPKFVLCKDQFMRNFLQGLQRKHTTL